MVQLIKICFIKIRIGLTFLVPAYPGCSGKEAVTGVCVSVYLSALDYRFSADMYL